MVCDNNYHRPYSRVRIYIHVHVCNLAKFFKIAVIITALLKNLAKLHTCTCMYTCRPFHLSPINIVKEKAYSHISVGHKCYSTTDDIRPL